MTVLPAALLLFRRRRNRGVSQELMTELTPDWWKELVPLWNGSRARPINADFNLPDAKLTAGGPRHQLIYMPKNLINHLRLARTPLHVVVWTCEAQSAKRFHCEDTFLGLSTSPTLARMNVCECSVVVGGTVWRRLTATLPSPPVWMWHERIMNFNELMNFKCAQYNSILYYYYYYYLLT